MVSDDGAGDLVSQIERLTKLRAQGFLTDEHFEAAMAKLLGLNKVQEAASVAVTGPLTCPNCARHQPADAQFCESCGTALSAACALCGAHNGLSTKFCRSCGTDIHSLVPGLTLERAKQWREMWGELGWWDDMFASRAATVASELLARARLPSNSDKQEEYWLFSCQLSSADWKIGKVWLGAEAMSQASGYGPPRYLVATRCQFLLFDLPESALHLVPFHSISSMHMQRHAAVFHLSNGLEFSFSVNAKGPRILDRARLQYWSFSDNTAERYLAGRAVGAAKADQEEFLQLVGGFATEIANIGKTAPSSEMPAVPTSVGGRHELIQSLAREDDIREPRKILPLPDARSIPIDMAKYNERVYAAIEARRALRFRTCSNCNESVADSEQRCPDCGTVLP